jgi:large subunit ribosomal protein L19
MSNQQILHDIEQAQFKTDLPEIGVGDTIDVHCRIIEGEKERIQVFTGVVIAIKGRGLNQMITVRRIVANEGVERVFPIHSPRIAKVEIVRHGHVRRSKLYFLRDRIGKARRLRDRRRGLKHLARATARHSEQELIAAEAGDLTEPTPEDPTTPADSPDDTAEPAA